MARENHIVLRASRSGTRDVFNGPLGFPGPFMLPGSAESAVDAVRVETESLSADDRIALARDADVVAIAPVMPLTLIAPFGDPEPVADPAAEAVTWGVRAVGADTSPFTGDGVVVAVLDTGIDAGHEAFVGVDLVEKDFTGEGDADTHGHGTHCAGTIFGRPVGGQRIGVAPGVTRALIGKVLGDRGGSSQGIAEAIQWALKEGAQVISMSLGMDFPGYADELIAQGIPRTAAISQALEGYRANVLLFEKLAALVESMGLLMEGAVLTAAAGNESDRPRFTIAAGPPAVSNGFLSVGAVMPAGTGFSVAPFSNTGPNVAGPGVGVVSARVGGGLVGMSGTSMATPHVAGVLALWAERLRGQAGNVSARELAARVVGSALRDGLVPAPSSADFGAGLVRAPQA